MSCFIRKISAVFAATDSATGELRRRIKKTEIPLLANKPSIARTQAANFATR